MDADSTPETLSVALPARTVRGMLEAGSMVQNPPAPEDAAAVEVLKAAEYRVRGSGQQAVLTAPSEVLRNIAQYLFSVADLRGHMNISESYGFGPGAAEKAAKHIIEYLGRNTHG